MSNVRISDLPVNQPIPSSLLPVEVMTSPGVYTTSRASLSTITQAAPNFTNFQSNFSTATALSAGWQTAYIVLCAYAPSWIANNTLTSVNSARWSSAYNTVTAYFPFWQAGYNFSVGNGAGVVSTVSANSAAWGGGQSVFTTVNAYSANWQVAGDGGGVSVYKSVNPLSAVWTSATKTVTALSANWQGVFTSTYPNSGNWQSVYTLVNSTTANTFLLRNLNASGTISINNATPIATLDLGTASAGINMIGWSNGGGYNFINIWGAYSSAALSLGFGYKGSSSVSNGFVSSVAGSYAKSAMVLDSGVIRFYTDTASNVAVDTAITPTERLRIENDGDVVVSGNIYGGTAFSSKTDSYTILPADNGTTIGINKATDINAQPSNATFPAGFAVTILQLGAGRVTILNPAGAAPNNAYSVNKTATTYSAATLLYTGSIWIVYGDLAA
jgi:hypothetical protein